MNFEISIVDIIALIFSSIAIYLAFKNRRAPLREKLFDRQLDIFQEISNRIIDVEEKMSDWQLEKETYNNKKEIERIEDEMFEASEKLQIYLLKVEIYIPEEIHDKFGDFLNYINIMKAMVFNKKIADIDVTKLSNKVWDLQQEIREFIGLESLSKENRKLSKK